MEKRTLIKYIILFFLTIPVINNAGPFDFFNDWGNSIKKGFEDFGDMTKKGFEDFGDMTKKGFEDFGKQTKSAFEDLGDKIKTFGEDQLLPTIGLALAELRILDLVDLISPPGDPSYYVPNIKNSLITCDKEPLIKQQKELFNAWNSLSQEAASISDPIRKKTLEKQINELKIQEEQLLAFINSQYTWGSGDSSDRHFTVTVQGEVCGIPELEKKACTFGGRWESSRLDPNKSTTCHTFMPEYSALNCGMDKDKKRKFENLINSELNRIIDKNHPAKKGSDVDDDAKPITFDPNAIFNEEIKMPADGKINQEVIKSWLKTFPLVFSQYRLKMMINEYRRNREAEQDVKDKLEKEYKQEISIAYLNRLSPNKIKQRDKIIEFLSMPDIKEDLIKDINPKDQTTIKAVRFKKITKKAMLLRQQNKPHHRPKRAQSEATQKEQEDLRLELEEVDDIMSRILASGNKESDSKEKSQLAQFLKDDTDDINLIKELSKEDQEKVKKIKILAQGVKPIQATGRGHFCKSDYGSDAREIEMCRLKEESKKDALEKEFKAVPGLINLFQLKPLEGQCKRFGQ